MSELMAAERRRSADIAAQQRIAKLEADMVALLRVVQDIDEAAHGGNDTIELLIELNRIGKAAREALTRIQGECDPPFTSALADPRDRDGATYGDPDNISGQGEYRSGEGE